jgi:hypothetical protein
MRTFVADTLNDLVIGSNGNLNTYGDINAIAQTARQFMQARRGEMIHKADEGVPFDFIVWGASPNIAQFEAVGRARLLQAPDVLEVLDFTATQSGDILTYTAVIRTTAGETTING